MKPLLLDFGGVLLKTIFELRHVAEPALGPLPWAGPFDPDNDDEWLRFRSGETTERQLWARRAATFGLDTQQFMAHFFNPSGDHLIRPEMTQLVIDYRASGGVVGMLTNDLTAFHGREWTDGISVLREFDFIIDGSITGILKPDPRAFQFALDQFGNPPPEDVVFVDDLRVNLGGSDACGLTSVWFDPTDPAGSIERIHAALAV